MKKQLLLIIFINIGINAYAQNYLRETGLRGGLTSGFTLRQYLNETLAYEGMLSFRKGGLQVTLLRQIQESSLQQYHPNLYLLYGFGAHAGFYFSDSYRPMWYNEVYYPQKRFSPLLGVDGYAAVEYKLDSAPFTFGLDYKPFFEFSLHQFFKIHLWDFAFTAKYRF